MKPLFLVSMVAYFSIKSIHTLKTEKGSFLIFLTVSSGILTLEKPKINSDLNNFHFKTELLLIYLGIPESELKFAFNFIRQHSNIFFID